MRGGLIAAGRPLVAGPVDQVSRRFLGHALPPDIAFVGQSDIGEDGIGAERRHGVGIRFLAGTRSDAEEAGFRIDRVELAVCSRLDPGDVVADGRHLPSFGPEGFGWYEHGEVGLAAGAGKGGGDVAFSHPAGFWTPRISICSASHPSSRASTEAMRSAKHFLPRSALPPYPEPYDQIERSSGKCTMYLV